MRHPDTGTVVNEQEEGSECEVDRGEEDVNNKHHEKTTS